MSKQIASLMAITVALFTLTASAQVTGSGTSGKITKWTGGTTVGDSSISESSGNVGIGTPPTGSAYDSMLKLFPSTTGINLKLYEYTTLGSTYASWATVLGWNVGAAQTTGTDGMVTLVDSHNLNPQLGAAAIRLGNDGIAFHTKVGPVYSQDAFTSQRMLITPDGKVGIGTTPADQLHVFNSYNGQTFITAENTDNEASSAAALRSKSDAGIINVIAHSSGRTSLSRWGQTLAGWNEVLSYTGNGLAIGSYFDKPLILGTNNADRIHITPDGTVGIGTATPNPAYKLHVNGAIYATSVIGAVYQDVAEWVPATTHMTPGTVVVLNRDRRNEVMPSAHAYDTAVAGVVSAQPGVILGEASDSKAQVATTGRVKVHVDATAGAISVGDLLVTSDKPGTAMKSQPVDLGGVAIHRPGTVIGKALEPLPNGEGEILVLLSLQ